MARGIALLGVLAAVQAGPAFAQLDGRLGFLARQLQKASDPRVRAQNAILLAAAKDAAVVAPLCGALGDENDLVRTSVAKALGQLGEISAIDCLTKRKKDPAEGVRVEVERSLVALLAIANRKPELYLLVQRVVDKTSKLPPEVLTLAEDRMKARLKALGGVFAPDGESKTAAKAVLKKQKLKGYMLKVELDSTPTGGLKVNLVCFTYPDRSLLGEVNVKASGGQVADMVRALAPKVIDEAADNFDWSE